MNLKDLHRKLLNEGNMFSTHDLPVKPKVDDNGPVIVMDRWKNVNNVLVKEYQFRTIEQRNSFVRFLLSYEEDIQHCADITINEGSVALKIKTKDVEDITELDREYARFADANYKDVVYNKHCE